MSDFHHQYRVVLMGVISVLNELQVKYLGDKSSTCQKEGKDTSDQSIQSLGGKLESSLKK